MTKKQKLILGAGIVVVIFFGSTFSKNWGTAVSENLLEKYTPEVKTLRTQPKLAAARCPSMIQKLKESLPELAKSQDPSMVPKAKKLIAECAFAAHDFEKAVEYYQELSVFEPNVYAWHYLIAESYYKMNKPAEALKPSTLACQLEPRSFKARRLNARVLASLQLSHRATLAYTQAIKVAPFDEIQPTKKELAALLEAAEEAEAVRAEVAEDAY